MLYYLTLAYVPGNNIYTYRVLMIVVYDANTCLFHNLSRVLNQNKASDFPTSFGGNVSNCQWPTRRSIKAADLTCLLSPFPRLSTLIPHTFYTTASHPLLFSPKTQTSKCALLPKPRPSLRPLPKSPWTLAGSPNVVTADGAETTLPTAPSVALHLCVASVPSSCDRV